MAELEVVGLYSPICQVVNKHGDPKSPKDRVGCGTPSKWPFLWLING